MKLGSRAIRWPLSEAGLTAKFAAYSFLCIGTMTVALWFIVSNYLISQILQREWQTTARIVRADVKKFLEDYDFKAEDRKSVGPKFVALLDHMRLFPDIVRFKVYNPTGVVLWSDDKRLVGKIFTDNDELRQALRGKIVADVSSLDKPENVFEQDSVRRAVEVYVPIFSDDGEMLGVFETYKRADSIYRDVQQARLVVLFGALGGGVLLHLTLFAIVRQAARKIDEQQENLLKMQSALIASQRMAAIGEMAAAVAHGIGNPLSSIRAAAQVAMLDADSVQGSPEGAKMKANLQSIMRQVDRVQKRMQGLLNFAKPMEPYPVAVDVNMLLRNVVETLKPRFSEGGIRTALDLAADLPPIALDANHLEQAFMGLITNAVEATPQGGQIRIVTKMVEPNGSKEHVQVAIEDTGEGIPRENRQRVFEPFFTTKTHGTGLGLPLAKKFVERNGGTITISETPTGGAKIEVTLGQQTLNRDTALTPAINCR
ncbi:MAG TPA: ATP-binding protein [Candidatus Binatia bacterium]|nr:ATP-binding protein [Candidatus Binatia bacterium]